MRRPLQVYLDDVDLDRLEEWARVRGWTRSQTIRAAVRALVRSDEPEDPLLASSGMIDGLPPDQGERFDEYPGATFVAGQAPQYRGKTRTNRQRPRR